MCLIATTSQSVFIVPTVVKQSGPFKMYLPLPVFVLVVSLEGLPLAVRLIYKIRETSRE